MDQITGAGHSKESVEELFDGVAVLKMDGPWPGKGEETQHAEFRDGGFASVGECFWVWAYNFKVGPDGKYLLDENGDRIIDDTLQRKDWFPIKKMVTTDTPGVLDVTFDDGSDKGYLVVGLSKIDNPDPELPVVKRDR